MAASRTVATAHAPTVSGLHRDIAEMLGKPTPILTVGELVDIYIRERVVPSQRPRTQVENRRHLEQHWLPIHEVPAHQVNRRIVTACAAALARHSGPVAANRARAALSAMFAWAVSAGLADVNPVTGTIKVGIERPRDRVLSDAEVAAIWRASGDGDHGQIVRLLLLTGQRRDEVGGMAWTEIDLAKALWSLPATRTKNHRPHSVPLSAQALDILANVARRSGCPLLFGKRAAAFSGWSRSKNRLDGRIARNRAAERLGRPLAKGEKPDDADALAPWGLHDIRRTAVTGMVELGVQPHVVEALVNHYSGHRAGVAGVYNRAHYSAEKRAAADLWAAHVTKLVGAAGREVDDGEWDER